MTKPGASPIGASAEIGRVWSDAPDYTIAEWNNALLITFRGPLSVPALETTRIASHDLHARWPEGIVVFSLVPGTIPLPTADVRKMASAVIAETRCHILRTVTVLQGGLFWVSAARAVVATITLLGRSSMPHQVFSTVSDGAKFAAPSLRGPDAASAKLAQAVERLLVQDA